MTEVECKLLRDIMPIYVDHLNENPDSLLVRFYGNIIIIIIIIIITATSIIT